jgi:hypothetical protein
MYDHRSPLATVAQHREPSGSHEREEGGLAGWLVWAVEPRWAHDHRVEPAVDRFEDTQFGLHLRLPVTQVRVIRLVVAERVGP